MRHVSPSLLTLKVGLNGSLRLEAARNVALKESEY